MGCSHSRSFLPTISFDERVERLYVIRKHCLQISTKYWQCMSMYVHVNCKYILSHTQTLIWIWLQYDLLIISFKHKKTCHWGIGGGIGGNTLLFLTELPPRILHQRPAHSRNKLACPTWVVRVCTCFSWFTSNHPVVDPSNPNLQFCPKISSRL